jgi:acyl-CoA synthetase (AMP-forming)/AMP-acid ligase II
MMKIPKDINELIEFSIRNFGEKKAFVFQTSEISFNGFGLLSKRVAKGFFDRGVRKGDRVALFLRNCVEVPITIFGAVRIGAIPTFLNAFHKGNDVFNALSNCEPKAIVVEGLLYQNIEKEANRVKSIKDIFLVGKTKQELTKRTPVLPFDSLFHEGDTREDSDENDIAAIVYTAGTEGKPKGAMLSHKGIMRDLFDRVSLVKISSEIKVLILAPFFHIAGFRNLLMSIYRGNTSYVMPFKAEEVLKLIHTEKIGFIVGAPTVYKLMFLREDFEKYDLSSLKVVGVGGAPSTPEFVDRLFKTFPQALIYNGYGQTELTGGNIVNLGEDFRKRPDSVGKIAPGHELRIIDEGGNSLPPGKVGEVAVRGDYVFKGYWGMPEATSQKIRNGWLYTGDLGWLDEDGFLYLVGRKSDMIIRGGENIYPQEVENCLESHPSVEEAAVIGVPDEVMGEEIRAFVRLKKHTKTTEKVLQDFCNSRIARYKVPKYIKFVEDIPHVAAGKIDRKLLRKEVLQSR